MKDISPRGTNSLIRKVMSGESVDFTQKFYPYGNQNAAMKIVADLATNEHAIEVLDMARELLEWREANRARKAGSERRFEDGMDGA